MKKVRLTFLVTYPDIVRQLFIHVSSLQRTCDHSWCQFRCCSLHDTRTARWFSESGGELRGSHRSWPRFLSAFRIAYSPALQRRTWRASSRNDICLVSPEEQTNASSSSTWAELNCCGSPVRGWGEARPDLTVFRTWRIVTSSWSAISLLESPTLWSVSI